MYRLSEVPIEEIDIKDRTLCFSFGRDRDSLKKSIRRRGLLVPCLLREKEGPQAYQIIAGFRRIEASIEIGLKSIKAFVVNRSSMGDEDAIFLSIEENIFTRGLNIIERAMIINIFQAHLGWEKKRIVDEVFPIIGLKPSPDLLDAHYCLLNLIDPLKEYIIREGVSLSNAEKLSSFSRDYQEILAEILPRLKLTENILKEVLTLIAEIMERDGISFPLLLEKSGILDIFKKSNLPRPQLTNRVRYALHSERYPNLQGMEKEFERLKKSLHIPPFLSIDHSPYFEEEGIRVSFRFTNIDDFRQIARWFITVAEREEIKRLLEIGIELKQEL
jgi:ParB family chromosome partitioning protein